MKSLKVGTPAKAEGQIAYKSFLIRTARPVNKNVSIKTLIVFKGT
jgi:hypothetical protein